MVVQLGLRYDWFDSRASRPCFGLDGDGNAVGCRIFDESGNAVDNSAIVAARILLPRISTSNEFEGSGGDPRTSSSPTSRSTT